MIEFLIENIDIQSQNNKESFLDKLESELLGNRHEFVIIISLENFDLIKTREIVNEIKKHFDIFIILKIKLPNEAKELEKYFSSGIHGVFFLNSEDQKNNIKVLTEASGIFTKGTVFYQSLIETEEYLKELIEIGVIPVIKSTNTELHKFVEINLNKRKNLKGYLKFIPIIEEFNKNSDFNYIREHGIKEKIEKKIILELNNLRQKLMIKEVEDSFNSSSL
jgi:hypothetical protein